MLYCSTFLVPYSILTSIEFMDVMNDTLLNGLCWNASILLSGYRVEEARLREEGMNDNGSASRFSQRGENVFKRPFATYIPHAFQRYCKRRVEQETAVLFTQSTAVS